MNELGYVVEIPKQSNEGVTWFLRVAFSNMWKRHEENCYKKQLELDELQNVQPPRLQTVLVKKSTVRKASYGEKANDAIGLLFFFNKVFSLNCGKIYLKSHLLSVDRLLRVLGKSKRLEHSRTQGALWKSVWLMGPLSYLSRSQTRDEIIQERSAE